MFLDACVICTRGEMAYTLGSGPSGRKAVEVQLLSGAPHSVNPYARRAAYAQTSVQVK